MENHIYAASYSPSTNYRSFRDPPADTMFLSHHLHHHRTDASSAAALRFPSSALSAVEAADIAPPGVTSRIASSSAAAAAANFLSTWPPAAAAAPSALDLKRSSEALYHPTILGTIGQSEAWYSTNPLAKRPRYESASNMTIYPQRPGEKDCAHYMLTRTCKFGDSCKFDHPVWVPEGGIPDWKEVPNVVTSETPPERPGEPDCPYFLKTQRCKFGSKCKFNHPKVSSENADVSSGLPERPSEPPCAFYMKTGKCRYGTACKFHHPKDIQIQLSDDLSQNVAQTQTNSMMGGATGDTQPIKSLISPSLQNSKGLPVRLGEVDCPFYMKTGSCKYGVSCRYNHPDRNAINPPIAGLGASILPSSAANLNIGLLNPAVSAYQAFEPRLSNPMVGIAETIYPQRPGQIECDFYMKTGVCKFGERCKYHHPIDRSALSLSKQATVKLTPAGLPRREGDVICPYYLKTGTCKFGATCKFDHPPPGERDALPGVISTNRDQTLMNAVKTVFPDCTNLLCSFHINKNVKAKRKSLISQKNAWDYVMDCWGCLTDCPSEQQFDECLKKFKMACAPWPMFVDYVKETWIIPHKEKKNFAWNNKVMHLGNTTTNRVESAHSSLKRLLQNSLGDLCSVWDAMNNMITLQHTKIKTSFETSTHVVGHVLKKTVYRRLLGMVSRYALNQIVVELERVDYASKNPSSCGCVVRITLGLPCACELSKYVGGCIPLDSIHMFWRRLRLSEPEVSIKAEIETISKRFKELDVCGKFTLKTKLWEIAYHDQNSMCPPPVKVNTKGALKKAISRNPRSTKRYPSYWEYVDAFESMQNSNSSVRRTASSSEQLNRRTMMSMLDQFQPFMHDFIDKIVDVKADGNCGYRSVADLLGIGEDSWSVVRNHLLKELAKYSEDYIKLFGGMERFEELRMSLLVDGLTNVTTNKWMDITDMGHVIVSRIELTLFSHVQQVYLKECCSLSPVALLWSSNCHPQAKPWTNPYITKMQHYKSFVMFKRDYVEHIFILIQTRPTFLANFNSLFVFILLGWNRVRATQPNPQCDATSLELARKKHGKKKEDEVGTFEKINNEKKEIMNKKGTTSVHTAFAGAQGAHRRDEVKQTSKKKIWDNEKSRNRRFREADAYGKRKKVLDDEKLENMDNIVFLLLLDSKQKVSTGSDTSPFLE
ncbi:Zinc finger CCCH domain-containing protein 37 [Glycine max]|nr:Zinc finger CCCH domain-containing protein 37 [Glycine max]